jgi:enoyl-CoA hydratase/carnithine racemase
MSEVLKSLDEQVLTLTLNRVAKQNAITRDMYQLLADALNDAKADFAIRAVVITHEGEHFTAGNDIFDFLNNPAHEPGSPVWNFLQEIHSFTKPLLAAVSGNAIGIGTTMLLHCDITVASETTKFSMPFVNLGLVPEAGATLLFPRLVGYQKAAHILLAGEPFSAQQAVEMGLIAGVAKDPKDEIKKIALKLASQPPNAILQTKALLKSDLHEKVRVVMQAEAELFLRALESEEAQEAFMKLAAKKGK